MCSTGILNVATLHILCLSLETPHRRILHNLTVVYGLNFTTAFVLQ